MLKVAVIGLGDISKIHVPIIQNSTAAQLVAVCDIDESLSQQVPGVNFYTDYMDMLNGEELDCVHICLPHYLHYPATKACAERNIHVFQEKPLASNVQDGKALVDLEAQHPHLKIGISFQNRVNESVEKLQELIAEGEYGNVLGLKGLVTWYRPKRYYDDKPWRGSMELAGGGVMINQSIHTLDLLQLFGGRIETIRGSVDTLVDIGYEVEDTASAHITFKNGASGLFFATNTNSVNSSVEFQAILEKGKFTIKDSILYQTDDNGQKVKLVEDSKLPGSKFYYGASHVKLINQFYTCIEQNTEGYIHAKDAQISMEMIDAIYRSSAEKKAVKLGESK